MSDYWVCAKHNWSWDNDEKCALCEATESEQARIEDRLDKLLVSLQGAYPTDYALVATLRQIIKGEME